MGDAREYLAARLNDPLSPQVLVGLGGNVLQGPTAWLPNKVERQRILKAAQTLKDAMPILRATIVGRYPTLGVLEQGLDTLLGCLSETVARRPASRVFGTVSRDNRLHFAFNAMRACRLTGHRLLTPMELLAAAILADVEKPVANSAPLRQAQLYEAWKKRHRIAVRLQRDVFGEPADPQHTAAEFRALLDRAMAGITEKAGDAKQRANLGALENPSRGRGISGKGDTDKR